MGTIQKNLIFSLILSFMFIDLSAEAYTVKMLNQGATGVMVFEPAFLKINVGDTVTFESTDAAHNSASIPGMIPSGASPWNGQLSRDISVTFEIPGVYGYQCTPHAMMAMVGVIQVGDDNSNIETAKNVATQFKSSFVMNQTRLDEYLSKINYYYLINFLCKITPLQGRVTQLVRVSARHAGSREFESLLAHQYTYFLSWSATQLIDQL